MTIKASCQTVISFLSWLEDSGKWKPNVNYSKLLKCNAARLYTALEQKQKAKGQHTYTQEELATLYAHANEQQRLYLLLGLNLCAAQQTLADLLVEDVHLTADQPYIEFTRGKTRVSANGGHGIEVRYDLWEQTTKLLAARMRETKKNDQGLALLTEDCHPLIRFCGHGSSKTDSVAQAFTRLLSACNQKEQQVRSLGFKYIRKTVATWVLQRSDPYTQQLALAHASQTVAGHHYTGAADFRKMNNVMKAIWADLWPKFEAAAREVEGKTEAERKARQAAYKLRQQISKKARLALQRKRELELG